MAFSVKQIKAVLSEHGMPVENLDKAAEEICGRHSADLDSIKEQRDSYKKDAETLADVQKELDALKSNNSDVWKDKYEKEHKEHEDYRAAVQKEKDTAEKRNLFRAALKAANVDEKRVEAILKVTNLDEYPVKDHKFEDEKAVNDGIVANWSDFIVQKKEVGAPVATPPQNNPSAPKLQSRAAQLAANYNASLYGVAPKAASNNSND